MTSRDRVLAALRGGAVDRPPLSFWGHVYHRESSADDLVAHTLERWRRFRWDWVKLNPRKHYHVEPWGVRYHYTGVPDEKPTVATYPVHAPADWDRIGEVPHDAGALGEQLDAVRKLRAALPAEVPLLQTVFTPLAILAELTEPPEALRDLLDVEPARIERALEAVTRTFERYVAEVMRAGADGIYLATTDWGSRSFMTPARLRRWSRPYDLRLLAAAGETPYHTLHVCTSEALLAEFADYPVGAFSWDATVPSNPSLAQGLALVKGAVMGGIGHETELQRGPRAAISAYHRSLEATGGRRWLFAPGCSIPPQTPEATLAALRDEVEHAPTPEGRP
ncbi:MAG TPA: uroporphyrinogen decarboxylase family protein [Candidatus Eisenbacteria bacterium]|jgi:uroporphyrinogen decarboxylase